MRRASENERAARDELRAKVRAAHDEGISVAAIARAAGVSREWVRRLYAK
jgi:DNA invertase Pin-like site-specific DNA recombinase